MSSMDRRTLLTAMLGACAVAGGLGAAATSALAVPRAAPPSPATGAETAEVVPEGEATLHNAQYYIRRRRRRVFYRRIRRRRRVYFY